MLPPFVASKGSVQVLSDYPEGSVAVVGKSIVQGNCDETMGEGSPQEFGGNQMIAACSCFFIGPHNEFSGHFDMVCLVHALAGS